MFHNIRSAYPNDEVWTRRIASVDQIFYNEIRVIDRCASCYLKYYQTTEPNDPFNVTCDTPHALVWYWDQGNWWPAKAYEYFVPGSFALDYDYFNVKLFGNGNDNSLP